MGLFVGNFCFYIRLSLLKLCGSERLAAALIEAAEHLVELQTQALNAREQTLKGDDDDIAYDDNGDVAAVTAEGEHNHHHAGMDYNKRADTKEGHGVAEIGKDIFDKLEQVLEQEVNDAVGLPVRMLVYNTYRYLL